MCREINLDGKEKACAACLGKLNFIGDICCNRCGKDLESEEQEYCQDCYKQERTYIRGFPAIRYGKEIDRCIMDFKYGGKKNYGDFLASLIIKRHGDNIKRVNPEVLIPIPVHKSRYRTRGYNQAEILATFLSKKLDIPVKNDLLLRQSKTLPQKELDNIQREKNLKKAFISDKKSVEYNRVMIVDDIYTTGATIESCTKVLHEMGVSEVFYTSICIGRGY